MSTGAGGQQTKKLWCADKVMLHSFEKEESPAIAV